jgi:lipopolysaccharide/colanic/teichoic acid biosynthesis glycosyltransferase
MTSGWLRRRAAIERAVAGLMAVVLAPLLAAVAGIVWVADRAAPLIALPRVGRNRNVFPMWKVRTMAPHAEGPRIAAAADSRVTAVGRWLRRTRLDELPQLLNVLRGEMAIIGPRPEAPAFVDGDQRWDRTLAVPPGLTGLSQVVVHAWELEQLGEEADERVYRERVLPVKLELDEWYVQNATPRIDLLILVATLQRVVLRSRRTVVGSLDAVRRLPPAVLG